MKIRIQDPEIGLDHTAQISGDINEPASSLISKAVEAAKQAMLEFEFDAKQHRITKDETESGTRTLVLDWADGCEMPLTITAEKAVNMRCPMKGCQKRAWCGLCDCCQQHCRCPEMRCSKKGCKNKCDCGECGRCHCHCTCQ